MEPIATHLISGRGCLSAERVQGPQGGKKARPLAAGSSGSLPRAAGARAAPRTARTLHGRQFAEAFYLMVMASELRGRARALGRHYGLESFDMRAEVMRYLERFCADQPAEARTDRGVPPAAIACREA